MATIFMLRVSGVNQRHEHAVLPDGQGLFLSEDLNEIREIIDEYLSSNPPLGTRLVFSVGETLSGSFVKRDGTTSDTYLREES